MIRRPPRSTLFPYTTALPISKFPTATVAQTKDRILRGADRKPQLNGKVATGARLNLYKAGAESTAGVSSGVLRFTAGADRKSTRLNSSHANISYAVFCLKKKK